MDLDNYKQALKYKREGLQHVIENIKKAENIINNGNYTNEDIEYYLNLCALRERITTEIISMEANIEVEELCQH